MEEVEYGKEVPIEVLEEQENTFKSEFGNFNSVQDFIIKYGRGKKFLTFWLLHIIGFIISVIFVAIFVSSDLTTTISGHTYSFVGLKIFIVLLIVATGLLPLAYTMIFYGSKKIKINIIDKGLRLASIVLRTALVLWIIVMVLLGIMLLVSLFSNFIGTLFIGAIAGGFSYVIWIFLQGMIDFFDKLISGIKGYETRLETPEHWKPYIIITIILVIFDFILSLRTGNAPIAGSTSNLNNLLNSISSAFSWIPQLLSIVTLFYTYHLINDFYMSLVRYFIFTNRKCTNHRINEQFE